MDTQETVLAQQTLAEASEKFELLKNNAEYLPVNKLLHMATVITDQVCGDNTLKRVCDADASVAQSRKALLDDIHDWINKQIDDIAGKKTDDMSTSGQVTDLDRAKKAMVSMIHDEQAKNIFEVPDAPEFFDKIQDCQTHAVTLCRVAQNCQSGKFLALVLGDFQSGKSTTIDALCDGHHISAIGDGTATSAVLVMVSYGEQEGLKVYWRAKEQLMIIFDRIKRILPDYNWGEFDLDKGDERVRLAETIDQLRQSDAIKKAGQTLEHGDVKLLMLCDLILAYYGTDELQAKKSTELTISDISYITRFPKDGEAIWRYSGVKDFTIDNALFVFIDSVSCTIPSETLKRLNCTVIDSPGLFNSAYDTMVTESAMVAAHAIIYVLPYHKGIGQDVCRSLYAIRDRYQDVHKKLFVVNNVDSQRENAFVVSNCAFVKSTFGEDKQVYVYDAKVSYLAQLKRCYDSGKADYADYEWLMRVKPKSLKGLSKTIEFKTFDEAWAYHMRRYTADYYADDTPSADALLRDFGFDDMTEALKAFIDKNESYAVIMSNALMPMRSELLSIRRELKKLYVEPYTKSQEDMAAIWATRIANAEAFDKTVTATVNAQLFGATDGRSVCDRLSEEEYKHTFTSAFYSRIAREIAGLLYDNKSLFIASQAMRAIRDDITISMFPPRIKFKDDGQFQRVFGDLVTPLIKEKMCQLITSEMNYTFESINSGQDIRVTNIFSPVADNIKLILEREWDKLFKDDDGYEMADYLTVPRDLKGCVLEPEKEAETADSDFTSDLGIGATLLGGLVAQITTVSAGIASMIAGYIAVILCDPTLTLLIVSVLLGVGGALVSFIAPYYVRSKFVDFLTGKVEPKIREDARDSFIKLVNEQTKIILDRYAAGRTVDIKKLKNERDIALSPNPDQEEDCFRALEIIDKVTRQVSVYDEYKDTYVG